MAADALHRFGLLLVRDARATEAANDSFLDMLEAYFAQDEAAKLADVRAELYYQVGATPSRVELPRDHCARIDAQNTIYINAAANALQLRLPGQYGNLPT